LFRSAIEGEVIEITNANIDGLSAVCDEFGFGSLSQRLWAFKASPAHQQKVQVDALEERVLRLEVNVQALQGSHQTAAAAQAGLESDVRALKGWAGSRLDSAIVPALPPIFAEFQWKRFSLLWRGGRNGFGSGDFHSRCDGHANTLTVILDTNWNIFGGFTPVEPGLGRNLQGRCESEEFPFHAEESAQRPGAEICVEGRKGGRGSL
jgi:hypothetical protein